MLKIVLVGALGMFLGIGTLEADETPKTFTAYSKMLFRDVTFEVNLMTPEGPGPHPAVILMHGCAGNHWTSQTMLNWRKFFNAENIATLVLESNLARGWPQNICSKQPEITDAGQFDRTAEAYAAIRMLRTLPRIKKDAIVVMGLSHGAGTGLFLADSRVKQYWGSVGKMGVIEPPNAIIAHYPWCGGTPQNPFRASSDPITVPLLIQIGALDNWTPTAFCEDMYAKRGPISGGKFELRVLAGAHHSFDTGQPVREFVGVCGGARGGCGVTVQSGHHDPAFEQSKANIRDFLKRHLH